jgi:hypothetical protein
VELVVEEFFFKGDYQLVIYLWELQDFLSLGSLIPALGGLQDDVFKGFLDLHSHSHNKSLGSNVEGLLEIRSSFNSYFRIKNIMYI